MRACRGGKEQFMKKFIKSRRIRLEKIARNLDREKIWEEEQIEAYLDNALSDLAYMKGNYGQYK